MTDETITDRHPDRMKTLIEWERETSDPILERVAELERSLNDVRANRSLRTVRVHPFITVQALGRVCDRHHCEARVSWEHGRLKVVLVPKLDDDQQVPAFLRPQAE
jgi:hypothetical protein